MEGSISVVHDGGSTSTGSHLVGTFEFGETLGGLRCDLREELSIGSHAGLLVEVMLRLYR